ncbi:hypothetical protein BHE74_00054515 [Ensete ventricosum]|nr:hypothetical protein BHE74_00054515 [Ensete ventricosum]RZS22060.1 hypothetical protein BHM03_00054836 [Ensete ventricosum]
MGEMWDAADPGSPTPRTIRSGLLRVGGHDMSYHSLPPKGVMPQENREAQLKVRACPLVGLVGCIMVLRDFVGLRLVSCDWSPGRLEYCPRCVIVSYEPGVLGHRSVET